MQNNRNRRQKRSIARIGIVHLKYGATKLVRSGHYLSPIACNQPGAMLMSEDASDITCKNCNKRLDSWGRRHYCGRKTGIIKITKYHWPQVPRWLP